MGRNTINQIGAAILMGIISIGNIGFVNSGIWNTSAGTPVDISTMDAAAYQVDSVSQLKDGGYIVAGTAYGYQSDIKVEVTFDAAGAVVQNVQILSQAETEGLGANITGSGFREQFIGKEAPFGLKDKDMVILVPGTGAVLGAGAAVEEADKEPAADRRSNPERWNPEDQSPEAAAVRNLYQAGLLNSSIQKQPLTTAIADGSPEEQAANELDRAGLTTGTAQVRAEASMDSPEARARENLEQAGLTVTAADAAEVLLSSAAAIGINEVDAVSGATISSTAVVQVIDYTYFFLQDQVLQK